MLAVVAISALAAVGGLSSAAGCLVFDGKEVAEVVDVGPPVTVWVAPDVKYLELDDAVRACRWVLECPHLAASLGKSIALPVDDRSFSLCLHWIAGPQPPGRAGAEEQRALLQQVAAAGSCEEALGATWIADIDPAVDARCGGSAFSCHDNVAIDCNAATATRCDSPRFVDGSACVSSTLGSACASGTCEGTTSSTCAEDVNVLCSVGVMVELECTPLGLECGKALGLEYCKPSTGAVTDCQWDAGEARCTAGTRVELCFGARLGAAFDCSAMVGGQCSADPPTHCVQVGATCKIGEPWVDQCIDSKLRACVSGQTIDVDCQGLSCLPAAGTVSGRCGD
ncbi:MAG: hypothetical protein WKG00_11160 [Polyangiaceae bacterium]